MRSRACVAAALVLAAGTVAATQTVDEFDTWMRTIDERNQSVQQHIARKDIDSAREDAKVLRDSFELVEMFWAARDDGKEAVALSREARDRAQAIERALDEQAFDRASSEAIKVAATCTPCHRLHRPLP